jgi:hypothetical protein
MKPLFAPSPVDLASQVFFALLAAIAVATVSNGFLVLAGVSVHAPSIARLAATTPSF